MSATYFAWFSLLYLLFCLHDVTPDELQLQKIPKSKQIIPLGSNLSLNCTINNQTSHTGLFFRRRIKHIHWKKIEAISRKVVKKGQVYILLNVTKKNKGQYECRDQKTPNSTEIKWQVSVSINGIPGGLDKGSKETESKGSERKKTPRQKKPGKPGKPGKPEKPSKKRGERKKLGHKRPRAKKSRNKRPGAKSSGNKGAKKAGAKKPGPKKLRPTKRRGQKKMSKPVLKLKPWEKTVIVDEGSRAVLKCTARIQGLGQEKPVINWYRSNNKLVGCSNKKDSKCTAPVSSPYVITYKAHVIKAGQSKLTSYLRIAKTRRDRDKDSYLCVASIKRSSARQIIRLKINKGS